jgi:hypothetical protein
VRSIVLLTVALALGLPTRANASIPVAGGRYLTHTVLGHGVHLSVRLRVANDGREFADRSRLSLSIPCRGFGLADRVSFDGAGLGTRSVAVDRRGRFVHRETGRFSTSLPYLIRGRFVDRGRLAIGNIHSAGSSECRAFQGRFRARLMSRTVPPPPGAPSRCEIVEVAYPSRLAPRFYGSFEASVGCTTAREIVRRWNAAAACRGLELFNSCRIPGAVCQAIKGGRFSLFASARCTSDRRAGGVVELIDHVPCPPPANHALIVWFWALNLDCQTAEEFPIETLIDTSGPDAPCGEIAITPDATCRPVAGYACTLRGVVFGPDLGWHARCIANDDRSRALEFDYDP